MKREDVEKLLANPQGPFSIRDDLARALLAAMDEIEALKAKADAEYWRGREDAAKVADDHAERFDGLIDGEIARELAAAIRAKEGK